MSNRVRVLKELCDFLASRRVEDVSVMSGIILLVYLPQRQGYLVEVLNEVILYML